MCYEWFERRKMKDALEKGRKQAEALIEKVKSVGSSRQPQPSRQPETESTISKEKASA